MKRYLSLVIIAATLFGCGKSEPKLKVAATPVPHAELLEFVKSDLKEKGVTLEIIEIDDYNIPNRSLSEKEIDANFFQHLPFLDEQINQFSYCLVPIAKIHIEPMGIYSKKHKSIASLPDKGIIAVPSDPTNEGRALQLLEKAGYIKLNPSSGLLATRIDIIENPKNLQIKEIDAAMLPRVLKDVDAAIIPTNFALQASFSPLTDAIYLEESDSPYVNVLVIRCGDEERKDIEILREAMTSEKMRQHILEKYKGAIIPAF